MKTGVVLLSTHNARAEVLAVITLPKLIIMKEGEELLFFNNEFERIKKNFLGTLSDRSGVDVYLRLYGYVSHDLMWVLSKNAVTSNPIANQPLVHHSV